MNTKDLLSLSAADEYVQQICPQDHTEELLATIRQYVDDDLPNYTDALRHAFSGKLSISTDIEGRRCTRNG